MKRFLATTLLLLTIVINSKAQVENISSGTGSAYTLNVPGIFSLRNGIEVTFKAHANNVAAPSINVSGSGPIAILKNGGTTALDASDIKAGQIVTLAYDGSKWQMMNPVATPPAAPTTYWNPSGSDIYNNNGGNVGIGNGGNPIFNKLLLQGNVGTSTNTGVFMDIHNTNGVSNAMSGIRFKVNGLTGTDERFQAAIWHRWNTDYELAFAVRDNNAVTNVSTSDIKMVVKNTGTVGIGTTTPSSSLLHVHATSGSGNLRLTSASTGATASDGFSISNDGTTNLFMTQHENADWYFATNGGTTAMTIKPTGNVGIGTTTVNNKLDVEGAAVIGANYSGTNTAPTNGLLVEGNVGIGITPTQKLHVNGNVLIPAANDYMYATAKTNYSSISPVAFIPESATYFRTSVSGYINLSGGTFPTTGEVHAPVYLPNGAVITEVRFYIYDNDATYDFVYLQLFRYTMSSGAGIFSSVAIPTGTFGITSYATTPNYTVDNSLYQYMIRIGMPQNSTNHRLYGVRITYTVTNAD